MGRRGLEVADIFRNHGAAWREANRGHVSLGQLKVMSAIERCRTAALGGHVARCENAACGHTIIAAVVAIDIVPSVKVLRHASGSPSGRPNVCRCRIYKLAIPLRSL